MHPFNLLCSWRHFSYLLTRKFKRLLEFTFVFKKGHLLSLPATLDSKGTRCSLKINKIKITHIDTEWLCHCRGCGTNKREGSILSADRHITAQCLWGSLLYPPCAGHHFALHATTHKSKATREERLS